MGEGRRLAVPVNAKEERLKQRALSTLVKEDHRLEGEADDSVLALMQHRALACEEGWPGYDPRHVVRDYAAAVGLNKSTVNLYRRAWKLWQDQLAAASGQLERLSPADCLAKARFSEERRVAVEAVAQAKGLSPETIHADSRHAADARFVQQQVSGYQEKRLASDPKLAARMTEEPHQTAQRVAQQMESIRLTDEEAVREARASQGKVWNDTARCLDRVIYGLRDAVVVLRDADQPDGRFQVYLSDEMTKIQTLVDLTNLMIRGESGIDWDTELRKVVG